MQFPPFLRYLVPPRSKVLQTIILTTWKLNYGTILGESACNMHLVEFKKKKATYRKRILVAAGTILNSM